MTHIREQEELGRQCLLESSEKMMESNIERYVHVSDCCRNGCTN